MKRKLSIITLFAVLMLVFGSSSAFAQYGYADTWDDAIQIYYPGDTGGEASSTIDGTNDDDYYFMNNFSGEDVNFSLALYSPSGVNYDMQLIRVDQDGNILKVTDVYDYGGVDAFGAYLLSGQGLYIRVHSHGANDYDSSNQYRLKLDINDN
ncbi:hypothetical protein ABID47_005885 [Paenibacillus favisporus]|uniref:Uncharacterized protein n=1 Tax=Paenibacillus favisporus TaxID=221028 RepID=A0ABV2FBT4_9BACL